MKHITCIDDLRALHKRRVPKAFFDYCDRGSYAEETLRANREDMQQIKFRQRILVDVSKRDTSTTILVEGSPRISVFMSRLETSTRMRWRSLICCRSSRLARSVSSA